MEGSNIIYWDDAYSVGHGKIDEEHKRLFEIAKEIHGCEKSTTAVMEIVKELVRYTKFHFRNEENYMRSIEFPNLEEHISIHRQIIDTLNDLIDKIKKLPVEEIIKNVSDFIYNSVLQHILVEDKKVHHARRTRDELKVHFKWKEDYKIDDAIIDKEHKELFEIALRALNYHDKDIKKHIKLTIGELYTYMKTHFEHEEKYMNEINYPLVYEHTILHDKIIEQMNDFIKTLPKLKIEEFERKLIEYMDIWLINHILFEDRKILNYKK